jgi:hypothetical protein
VFYNGDWHSLGADLITPYTNGWETPFNLFSQQVLFRIDVIGTDMEDQLQRASYAGGVRRVNIIESLGDPNITEIWVPNRAYLNQRSLSPDGDSKCNVSSIAMILAMDGYISTDYLTMANTANGLAHYLLPDPSVEKECQALRDPVPSAYCSGVKNQTEAWNIIKSLVDAGHPVIVDSRPGVATTYGHYVVAIGYKEAYGTNYVITYDPYGEWRGRTDSYYRNEVLPASHVGKWVYYDFEEFTANHVYLFATITPPSLADKSIGQNLTTDAADLTPPDQISDEPRISVIFNGQETIYPQYLPMLIR